ncbi:hypothetical protein CC86DRAFT_376410 [Ophiobolus disseminans]|uniref:Homeobox domain-containing protein n=1 Tax=Ophiobolus disseminans TaxID=1469910 RepID=A0A6A7AKE1_9PLEO|nr:hypothetical protein CC86DRAFT_376410 [Ophiobolus disseminans]
MDPSDSPGGASKANAAQKPPTCDVKPRLTKEQHDVLEQHFQVQHKPSTLVKKDFASKLGVPLDKINNWFQNRRAKVKQDRKKVANQMNMALNTQYGMYGHSSIAVMAGQYSHHPEQHQLHMTMNQDYHAMTADISPASLPVQGVDGASALDLTAQMSLQQSYDMQALRSIPEANRSAAYPPNAVMDSFMAAANGSYMHNPGLSANTQDVDFPYDTTGFSNELSFSVPTDISTDSAPLQSAYTGYASLGGLPYDLNTSPMPAEAHQSSASLSTQSSPFSSAQTNMTPQSSNGPTPPSVASVVSAYSGWTEDPSNGTLSHQADESEDQFSTPYNLNAATSSEQTLPFWAQQSTNAAYGQGFYQQANVSSQAVLSSPDQDMVRKASAGPSDFDPPPMFHDDAFTRRNSSTSNLAGNFEAIQIRNGTPDEFKQPGQPTSIAQRRKGRPVTLNPGAMRSASYSAPMPSPGGSNDHALRRIRSSGIANAAGRVQKSQPGSAQRSPMVANFSEAAASPKFARTFSSSSTATMGPGGSLAPPTPLTPQDMGLYWQNNTVIRPHSVMPEHNSPESMNANWSSESQSTSAFAKSVSPPTTSLELQHMTQAQYTNEAMYRDSPPQSAPATQQNFPRPMYMQHPHTRPGFHSTTDLTIAQPKPSHYRRPSLPDNAQAPIDDANFFHNGNFNYEDYKDISLTNIAHNVPFAPRPSQAPEFLVHEFIPPQGHDSQSSMYRRSIEPQAKSYIFANQGPRDFKS